MTANLKLPSPGASAAERERLMQGSTTGAQPQRRLELGSERSPEQSHQNGLYMSVQGVPRTQAKLVCHQQRSGLRLQGATCID